MTDLSLTPTGLLRVQRSVDAWRVTGTSVEILPLHPGLWTIQATDDQGEQWLREQGIDPHARFRTRDEALRALSALHAADPIPAFQPPRRVKLIRAGVSPYATPRYKADDNSGLIAFADPSGRGWTVQHGDLSMKTRTLRDAGDLANWIAGRIDHLPNAVEFA